MTEPKDIYDEINLDPTTTIENPYTDGEGNPVHDLPDMFEDGDDPRTERMERDYD